MSKARGQMRLGAFFHPTGHHAASWRHPDAPRDAMMSFEHYRRMAQAAERGKFDLIFLADGSVVKDRPQWSNQYVVMFEPLTLLSALSMFTDKIGLIGTASTTYNEPFRIARAFASLDILSKGRAGWNLVTSGNPAESLNFNRDIHMEHGDRYLRAGEFADVVKGLWDSWDDDAFIQDKEAGLYVDLDRMHVLDHVGPYFQVKGPLNAPRPPQGHPVIVQAGSSDSGRELAARTAEVVFTSQLSLGEAQQFYADLKGRTARYGRTPDDVKIMPGVSPVVGRSRAEAEEKNAYLQSLMTIDLALSQMAEMLGGMDLSKYPLDGPMPQDLPETNAAKHFRQVVMDLGRRENLTLRQVALKTAQARSHRVIVGTAADIADQLEDWFFSEGCDGYNVMAPMLPTGIEDFVDLVVPELQRRGSFRTEYEGSTLREHLGLKRPDNALKLRDASRRLAS